MTSKKSLRLLTLVALLTVFAIPLASYAGQLVGLNAILPGVRPAHAQIGVNLGFDCAYGSSADGAAFPSSITTSAPYSSSDYDGSLNTSCAATYLADTDGVVHPLVSDNPTAIVAAGAGGGLTIDVVADFGTNTTTMNGFDITVGFDPHYLSGTIIDQSGLIWGAPCTTCPTLPPGGFILTLAKTIDNVNGAIRVAQVIVGAPQQVVLLSFSE